MIASPELLIITQTDLIGAIIAHELVKLQLQKTNLVFSYRVFYICLNFLKFSFSSFRSLRLGGISKYSS